MKGRTDGAITCIVYVWSITHHARRAAVPVTAFAARDIRLGWWTMNRAWLFPSKSDIAKRLRCYDDGNQQTWFVKDASHTMHAHMSSQENFTQPPLQTHPALLIARRGDDKTALRTKDWHSCPICLRRLLGGRRRRYSARSSSVRCDSLVCRPRSDLCMLRE